MQFDPRFPRPSAAAASSRLRTTIVLVSAFIAGGLLLPNLHITWREPASRADTAGLGVHAAPPQRALGPDEIYARAAEGAYKSVVNIDTTQRVRHVGFFGEQVSNQASEGSGVIITPDGYILTNEHVVGTVGAGNGPITVSMTDGRTLPGRLVGSDHISDIALVKVDGHNLPAARIGTAVGLVPGQMVVAIGNPFGLKYSVSHGVVSALGRPVMNEGRIYPDLIQHDALINPGNSGGALVNLEGQVIGINTLVSAQGPGIGFAIPIDDALKVADRLKRYGRIKRGWLGVITETNSQEYAFFHGLQDVAGAVVVNLYRSGPAVQAGVEQGDIITAVGGHQVASSDDVMSIEAGLKPGQKVELEVVRGNEKGNATITVGETP